MIAHCRPMADRRGIAAVEFALIAPILLLLLGGVIDFGLLLSGKGELANGLAQGVEYALLTGPGVSGTTVKTIITAGALLAGVTAPVTVSVTGPACYCVSGQPAVLSAASTALSATNQCTATCPATGTTSAAYMLITATFTFQPLMPLYSNLLTPAVTETVTVKLQ